MGGWGGVLIGQLLWKPDKTVQATCDDLASVLSTCTTSNTLSGIKLSLDRLFDYLMYDVSDKEKDL